MDVRDIMAKAIPAVEFMYDKTAEIKRYVEYKKPSGADGQRWETVHVDVPCRLSNPNLNNTVQGDANTIKYDTKMFLSSDYLVLAGDQIVVKMTIDGEVVSAVDYESSKEPFVYISHQEVLLVRKEYA